MLEDIFHYVNQSRKLLWDYYDDVSLNDHIRFEKSLDKIEESIKILRENGCKTFRELREARLFVVNSLRGQAKRIYFSITKNL